MNNLNNVMPGALVDPMAQRQQQVNPAVYNNQSAINKGIQMFGTPEMMQASVATMEQGQVLDPYTAMPVANQQQTV